MSDVTRSERSEREQLLVFVRLPRPGQVKTRLIPHLGAAGAAGLYRELAESTVHEARRAATGRSLVIHVEPSTGLQSARAWLGSDLAYVAQAEGDLGRRMSAAVDGAFARGAQSAVVIGSDCPDLTAPLIDEAYRSLRRHDVAIGPANDGGYYLLGLRRPVPEIFDSIQWSTDLVFAETFARLERAGLSTHVLKPLSDLDTIDDLIALRERQARESDLISSDTERIQQPIDERSP